MIFSKNDSKKQDIYLQQITNKRNDYVPITSKIDLENTPNPKIENLKNALIEAFDENEIVNLKALSSHPE